VALVERVPKRPHRHIDFSGETGMILGVKGIGGTRYPDAPLDDLKHEFGIGACCARML
jgi:hypothetical protein